MEGECPGSRGLSRLVLAAAAARSRACPSGRAGNWGDRHGKGGERRALAASTSSGRARWLAGSRCGQSCRSPRTEVPGLRGRVPGAGTRARSLWSKRRCCYSNKGQSRCWCSPACATARLARRWVTHAWEVWPRSSWRLDPGIGLIPQSPGCPPGLPAELPLWAALGPHPPSRPGSPDPAKLAFRGRVPGGGGFVLPREGARGSPCDLAGVTPGCGYD